MYYVTKDNIYPNHSSQLRSVIYNDTFSKLKNKWCCKNKNNSGSIREQGINLLHSDLDFVLFLKTIHKMKACI